MSDTTAIAHMYIERLHEFFRYILQLGHISNATLFEPNVKRNKVTKDLLSTRFSSVIFQAPSKSLCHLKLHLANNHTIWAMD